MSNDNYGLYVVVKTLDNISIIEIFLLYLSLDDIFCHLRYNMAINHLVEAAGRKRYFKGPLYIIQTVSSVHQVNQMDHFVSLELLI
jgi:hypothetical protein